MRQPVTRLIALLIGGMALMPGQEALSSLETWKQTSRHAASLANKDDFAQASAQYQKALDVAIADHMPAEQVACTLLNLGTCLMQNHQENDAETIFRRVEAICRQEKLHAPVWARTYRKLARLYWQQNRRSEAIKMQEQLCHQVIAIFTAESLPAFAEMDILQQFQFTSGKSSECAKTGIHFLSWMTDFGLNHKDDKWYWTLVRTSSALRELKRYAEASKYCLKAYDTAVETDNPTRQWQTLGDLLLIADLAPQGSLDKATNSKIESVCTTMFGAFDARQAADHDGTSYSYARFLQRQHRSTDAAAVFKELISRAQRHPSKQYSIDSCRASLAECMSALQQKHDASGKSVAKDERPKAQPKVTIH